MFDDKKIIRSHNFKQSEGSEMIVFLGSQKKDRIKRLMVYNSEDMDILKTWEDHFKLYDIPYAVEQKGDELYLWKERRA